MFVRDFKRNGTRVSKKRVAKGKQRAEAVLQPAMQSNPFAQFNSTFGQQQQFAQPMFQPFAPIPQAPLPHTYQPVMQSTVSPVQQLQIDLSQYPQLLQQQPPHLSQQQGDQNNQNIQISAGTVSSLAGEHAERHTRFLSATLGQDKAFRLPCTIFKPDGSTIRLDKQYTQADQGSDMNVMSVGLVKRLALELHPLAELGLRGLSMRTADYRDTPLHHWVLLRIDVEGVIRDIRCFVVSQVPHTTASGQTEYISLILGIPWLYSVDAVIFIRQSKIMVGDI